MASWQIWALAAAAFAAITSVLAKIGVENVSADVAMLIRTLVILAALLALVGLTRQFQALPTTSARSYLFLALSGLATGASWWCYFRALQVGDVARVAPLDKLSVVLAALFGVGFLGEKLAAVNWVGIALIAAGAWMVTLKG
ncbi:MAG: EamA family transporter [Proteobacteria bacterium]|nr:EamA family transporter [Pseudomonadota bacterium]